MRQLIVDPEFRDKMPPLSEDEFKKLKENILADGEVREPLVVWNNTIIDGHNRWKIIQEHPEIKIPPVKELEFSDRWAAIVWMCRNQLGRRNLTDAQKSYLLGKQYEAEKCSIKNKAGGNQYKKEVKPENLVKPKSTAEKIAKENGVSHDTVERAGHFSMGLDAAEEISPGFKNAVLSGQVKATKKDISEIRNMDDAQKKEAVEKIKSGESIKPKPPQKRYAGGGTKEYRELRESIEEIAADMYDPDKRVKYSVDDLIEEIRVNANAYIQQLKRTLEIRSTLLTDGNKPIVQNGIERYVFQELRKVVDLLK